MSASTIRSTVRMGESTVREAAALAAAERQTRVGIAEGLAGQRTAEYQRRGIGDAVALGELSARCDALADIAPSGLLEETQGKLATALAGGISAAELSRSVDALETGAFERYERRRACELSLQHVAAGAGSRLERQAWSPDGRLTATFLRPEPEVATGRGEVRIPVAMSARELQADTRAELAWLVAESDIKGHGTPERDCERQEEVVKAIAAEVEEMEVQAPASLPSSAKATPPRKVARRSG